MKLPEHDFTSDDAGLCVLHSTPTWSVPCTRCPYSSSTDSHSCNSEQSFRFSLLTVMYLLRLVNSFNKDCTLNTAFSVFYQWLTLAWISLYPEQGFCQFSKWLCILSHTLNRVFNLNLAISLNRSSTWTQSSTTSLHI